jgi:hypothetical protein
MPTKHVPLRSSLLGQSTVVLQRLQRPKTISTLWEQVRDTGEMKSYERFLLALDLLFILGVVEFDKGLLRKVSP